MYTLQSGKSGVVAKHSIARPWRMWTMVANNTAWQEGLVVAAHSIRTWTRLGGCPLILGLRRCWSISLGWPGSLGKPGGRWFSMRQRGSSRVSYRRRSIGLHGRPEERGRGRVLCRASGILAAPRAVGPSQGSREEVGEAWPRAGVLQGAEGVAARRGQGTASPLYLQAKARMEREERSELLKVTLARNLTPLVLEKLAQS
eukprot:SM000009S23527  [mRNA]  locus=s9:525395:526490:- [translate_table: standard]